jgi:DNA-binding MurR/RpiR family transcriptional regulator
MLKEFMEHVELLTEGTGDISNKLQYIEKEDCLIAISYERYTRATYNIVSYLNKKGCPVIAVTDSHSSPIASKATTVLLAKHAVDTYSFVNSMTVANALIIAAGRRDKDNTLKKLERQDEIALEYGLYL